MSGLTIGKVAIQAGLGVDTIRFYEREGLIPAPARKASGFREYEPAIVGRLFFIRRAKELGFSLREIGELLTLRVDERHTCADVRAHAARKIAEIESKLEHLERMKKALQRLTSRCSGAGPTGECPILEALEDGPRKDARDKVKINIDRRSRPRNR